MGYHNREIKKGVIGDFSKIVEEYEELSDAIEQKNPVLELVEITDLLGAIESFTVKNYNISLEELIKMTRRTQSSFLEGRRK